MGTLPLETSSRVLYSHPIRPRDMFDNLIESQAKKQKRAGGFVMSFVIHGILIAGAVYATYSVGNALEKPKAEKVDFVTVKKDEPPPPKEEKPPPPPDVVMKAPP